MRLVLALSMSLGMFAFVGCDSPDIDGVEDPSRADLDPPDNPDLCRPACQALTDPSCDALADNDGDIEILQGCVDDCLTGGIDEDDLECLAQVTDCAGVDECLE